MNNTIHHPQYFTATILKWQNLLKPDKYKKYNNWQSGSSGKRENGGSKCFCNNE